MRKHLTWVFFYWEEGKEMSKKDVNNPEVSDESQVDSQSVDTEATQQQVTDEKGTDSSVKEQPEEDSTTVEESFMGKKFDPKSLKDKPELEKAYKQMQSEWGKRNMEYRDNQKNLEGLSKWKKDLEENPYFQQWASDMDRLAKMQSGKQPDFEKMTEEEKFNWAVDNRVNEILNKKVQPFIDSTTRQDAKVKVDKFLADNPKAAEHIDAITKEMTESGVDMDKAWKYVKADFAKDEAKQEVLGEIETKRSANLQLPGKQPSTPAAKKKMSVEEAAELASRQTGIEW